MTYFIKSFGGKRFNAWGTHIGPGDWLNVVWEANKIEPGFFGRPTLENGVETYPHAVVIHKPNQSRDDSIVTIESRDSHGADVLTKAFAAFYAQTPAERGYDTKR